MVEVFLQPKDTENHQSYKDPAALVGEVTQTQPGDTRAKLEMPGH